MFEGEFDDFEGHKTATIKFTCPKCKKPLERQVVLPQPNMDGDSIARRTDQEFEFVPCDRCRKRYPVNMESHFPGIVTLQIEGLDEDSDVVFEGS